MTETINGHQPKSVNVARIRKLMARSISTDGESAQIVFEVNEDGENLVLEMPVAAMAPLQSLLAEMRRHAARKGLGTGQVFRTTPKTYGVGHSDDMRGFTALMFDEKTVNEQILMLADADAMRLAQSIIQNVQARGGPRREGLILPNKTFIPPNR